MIEGASNRVPAAPHWEAYCQAERNFPELIADLSQEIRKYAASLPEVNSTTAGSVILPKWALRNEWNREFGMNSSQLFGMVLWVTLFDDPDIWRSASETAGDRPIRIYHRA